VLVTPPLGRHFFRLTSYGTASDAEVGRDRPWRKKIQSGYHHLGDQNGMTE
jgi:hypothetical protein